MTHTKALLLALVGTSACVIEKADLGDEPTDGDATTVSTTDDPSTSIGEPELDGVGAPCAHAIVPESRLVTFPALDCNDLLCVYADISVAPAGSCTDDVECNATDPSLGRFECALPEGECVLAPEWIASRSMCSAYCDEAADCESGGPTSCVTGFSCEVMAVLGHSGCRPLCVCNDDLDALTAETDREDCEDGTAPACASNPGQGLCPD